MPKGTKAIADAGYIGQEDKVIIYWQEHSMEFKKFIGRARNRQETLHTRIKPFNVLKARFRHGQGTKSKMVYHKICMEAACVLVQCSFANGCTLFQC